jgi:hypothetical protein
VTVNITKSKDGKHMAVIKKQDPLAIELFELRLREAEAEQKRGFLGMGKIGHICDRHLWFNFRAFDGVPCDGRTHTIFDTGNAFELIVLSLLRRKFQIEHGAPDPQVKHTTCGGFFNGKMDGRVTLEDKTKAVLEIKSCNKDRFKLMQQGVIEASQEYYAQVQCYMHMEQLEKCLFVAMCKDNCDLNFEIVHYRKDEAEAYFQKAARIITSPIALDGLDDKAIECKWCDYRYFCKSPKDAIQTSQTCRSCAYLSIDQNFEASCRHPKHPCKLTNINLSCGEWVWTWEIPF